MAVIERIRAVAYCRYSSSNQHETSIEGQMRSIEEFCKKQNWILVSSYQDRAVSGTTDNREQFQKMISDSYNHNFERVVVYKLDRFARNRYDSIIYKNKLKKNDVLLCSVNENLTDSPEGVILESLLDGINEYYSKALSQIVIRGHLENAYKCVHNGGVPPLGYRVNSERKLEVVPEEAKIVKLIFELYTQGYGYSYILDRLNELNYHTKTGRIFTKSSLYEILSNPKYAGNFVYNRLASKDIDGKRNGHKNKPADKIICIEGGCDKIVSKAMFDKAQRIKAANKRNAGRYSSKEMYLLSGKVFCDCCGRKMTGNRSKCGRNKSLLVSYRCPSLKKICKNKEINATYLNAHVSVLIGQKLLNPKSLKKAVEIKRAALYARFSSDNQRTESIDAQVRAMKDFCNQNKWKIVDTYVDEAYSATNDRRPSFQRMIEDSGKGMFDIVLVHKLDRFSRNRYDSAIYKNKLKHNGVRLYSVLERLDDSPESIILESMLESIGEYYSSNIAREVMKGLKENAFHCKHTGGSAPLGYDVGEDKKLVINEREAEAVRIIYDMYINGYGYRNIAEYLNSKGYVTKKGNKFKPNSVSFYEILNNLKYTGTYVYNRSSSKDYSHRRNSHRYKPEEEIIKITGGCPAIISMETFQKATERRKSVTAKGQLGSKHFYLCSGIVVCGECGKKMFGRKRFGKYAFNVYCCTSYKADCSNIKEIDSARLDEHTVKLLEREMFNESAMKKRIAGLNKSIERYNCRIPAMRKSLNREIDKVNTELIKLHSKKEKSIETYEKINILESRKNDLEYAIDNLHEIESVSYSDYSNRINRFYELKEDNLRFRTFIQDYITSITVYRDKIVFCLNYGLGILDDVTKKYTFERKLFKTPTQKM